MNSSNISPSLNSFIILIPTAKLRYDLWNITEHQWNAVPNSFPWFKQTQLQFIQHYTLLTAKEDQKSRERKRNPSPTLHIHLASMQQKCIWSQPLKYQESIPSTSTQSAWLQDLLKQSKHQTPSTERISISTHSSAFGRTKMKSHITMNKGEVILKSRTRSWEPTPLLATLFTVTLIPSCCFQFSLF